MKHKVVEYAAVYVGHEAADLEQYVLAEVELQLLFIIVLHQFRVKLLVLLLEADFAGADVEPLYVVLGEEGVDDGSRAPCLAARLADEEPGLLYGVCRTLVSPPASQTKNLVCSTGSVVNGFSCSLSLLLHEARKMAATITKMFLQKVRFFIIVYALWFNFICLVGYKKHSGLP